MEWFTINYELESKTVLIECEQYLHQWCKENKYDFKKIKILTALIYLNIA